MKCHILWCKQKANEYYSGTEKIKSCHKHKPEGWIKIMERPTCKKCGNLLTWDHIENIEYCPVCKRESENK